MKTNEILGKIKARGLTLRQCAHMVGMHHQTLSEKIRGTRRIYLDEMIAISYVLELTSGEMLYLFSEMSEGACKDE